MQDLDYVMADGLNSFDEMVKIISILKGLNAELKKCLKL